MKLPKQKEQKFDFKVFYIKRRNTVLFNSIGIFYRVGSIAKLLNIKPVQEQEKTLKLADTQN